MVMYNYEDEWRNSTKGWKLSQVYKNTTGMNDTDIINPLWVVDGFKRSGRSEGEINGPISRVYNYNYDFASEKLVWKADVWPMLGASNILNPVSGLIVMDYKLYKPEYRVMQVDHCWSEGYEAPCRLSIANSLLLIVCIMCGLKCTLCFLVLKLRVWGDENPLMTPGDAIASFISRPDEETRGMCTLSLEDLKKLPAKTQLGLGDSTQAYKWLNGPRQWYPSSRKFGKAVPRNIWILSSLLIGSSLTVGGVMMGISLREQSLCVKYNSRLLEDELTL